MTKILLVTDFSISGGTYTYFLTLLKFYKSRNYNVLICINREKANRKIIELINSYGYKYKLLRSYKISGGEKYKFFISLVFDFFKFLPIVIKENPNMIVVSTSNPGAFLGLIVFPKKFLYILHSYPMEGSKLSIKSIILNIFLNTNKRILAVSEFLKKSILTYWNIREKAKYIDVVYNTIEGKAINNYSIRNRLMILTLSHVRWYKNPNQWIEVAKKINDCITVSNVEFVWAGTGELLGECRIKVKNDSNISFLGFVENIEQLYKKASVYFQPSLIESLGISVIEAMKFGLPCVVTNTGGLPEIIENNRNGFIVEKDDIDLMVNRIKLLINDEKIREKMGKESKIIFETKFCYDIWYNKMLKLHNSLLFKKNNCRY